MFSFCILTRVPAVGPLPMPSSTPLSFLLLQVGSRGPGPRAVAEFSAASWLSPGVMTLAQLSQFPSLCGLGSLVWDRESVPGHCTVHTQQGVALPLREGQGLWAAGRELLRTGVPRTPPARHCAAGEGQGPRRVLPPSWHRATEKVALWETALGL